jgi:hypothetical protein
MQHAIIGRVGMLMDMATSTSFYRLILLHSLDCILKMERCDNAGQQVGASPRRSKFFRMLLIISEC